MQITSVTLDNIKSYRRAVIHLSPGTTAIRGHNGAGKSTLVEAIGYALFDFLPYSPAARFIREGEKMGKVVVAFVSALDERLYEVERRCVVSGSAAWFVFDPELRQKVVEGKDDTLAFLRLHLGVQTTLPLPDLFDNAIAVQQGTFTADFLGTGGARKKKFDALLQVEEYRKAAEDLRDTVSHLKDALATHDRTIEGLAARTTLIDEWRTTRATLADERVAMLETISQLSDQRDDLTARITAATRRRDELAELATERNRAHAAWELAAARHAQTQAEATRAAEAHARCAATQAGYARHRAAQDDLARAQAEARTLAHLQLAATKAEHALHSAAGELDRATERLERAEAAAAMVADLAPQVARQTELDGLIAAAREAHNRVKALHTDRATIEKDYATAQRDGEAAQRTMGGLLPLQALAEARGERAARVQALQTATATRAERTKRLTTLHEQIKRQTATVARAAETLRMSDGECARAQAAHVASAELPAREAALAQLADALIALRAEMKQTEQSLHAAENGHCPFLKEPCQNLARRGIRGLDDFFGDQLTVLGARLAPIEAQHTALAREVAALSAHRSLAERLGEYEARLATARTAHAEAEAELARLRDEAAALAGEADTAATLADDLRTATAALDESIRADREYARLPLVRQQWEAIQERLAVLDERRAALAQTFSSAQAIAATLPALTAELRALGDPRQRQAVAADEAAKLPEHREALAAAGATHAAAQAALTQAQAQLAPFAGLEARIAALQGDLAATKDAHDDYLRHEAEAAHLPARQAHAAEAERAAHAAHTNATEATARYDAAAGAFDLTELDRLSGELHHLDGEVATLRERERQHKAEGAKLDRQIAEAEGWLTELAAAQAARNDTEATLSLLHYGRDTIKEAGPFVMRALLREISATANRIFGEIMGDRSAMLTWQEDYDITIRSGAYERHFVQLSGGEQMSAALAVRLALLKTLTRATIAFFDEPTQNMDDERRANLAGQIRRVTGFEQLVVISHDDTFEEGLDAVIRVHKEGGESQVESDPAATLPAPLIPFPTARAIAYP